MSKELLLEKDDDSLEVFAVPQNIASFRKMESIMKWRPVGVRNQLAYYKEEKILFIIGTDK